MWLGAKLSFVFVLTVLFTEAALGDVGGTAVGPFSIDNLKWFGGVLMLGLAWGDLRTNVKNNQRETRELKAEHGRRLEKLEARHRGQAH